MAHSVRFEKFDGFILSEREVVDLIDLFYRWGDSRFLILTNEKERKFRGEHCSDVGGGHRITLVRKNIEKDFAANAPCGGNLRSPTLKVAAAMVLAHELQHANQTKMHKRTEGFYKDHRYWNRACEREARQFADERLSEICAYFGVQAPGRQKVPANGAAPDEALAVAALLRDCAGEGSVTMDDIRDELRASGVLTPTNVRLVRESLIAEGIEITK